MTKYNIFLLHSLGRKKISLKFPVFSIVYKGSNPFEEQLISSFISLNIR